MEVTTGIAGRKGFPVKIPVVDIAEVGSGGGSIAWVDAGGALRVGPHSAGADPGPACYDLGGKSATLTDANGQFQMDMPQIVPAFGQAHGHLAYDSGDFQTVFLRPVMPSPSDASLATEFVLAPA